MTNQLTYWSSIDARNAVEVMKNRKLSQAAASKESALSRTTISRLMSGNRAIYSEIAESASVFFGFELHGKSLSLSGCVLDLLKANGSCSFKFLIARIHGNHHILRLCLNGLLLNKKIKKDKNGMYSGV